MITNQLARASFAEFVATALFVWIGCGSVMSAAQAEFIDRDVMPSVLPIATAFGFAISLLAWSIGHISGGHINPAVSFALYFLREVDAQTMCCYMVAQCGGAVLGALLLWGCVAGFWPGVNGMTDGPPAGLGVNRLSADLIGQGSGFLIEVMGTYLLVFTVCMSAVHKKSAAGNAAPIAIGWSVMMAHIVMIPFTGCGINPARSLGPMVVNSIGGVNTWYKGWWIFYTAPFVGAGLAAATYKAFAVGDEDEGEGEEKENLIQQTAPKDEGIEDKDQAIEVEEGDA